MHGIRYVEIGASDLARSLDFYQDLLGLRPTDGPLPAPGVRWRSAGPVLLRLVDVGPGGLGGRVNDDLQRGIRHVGLGVADPATLAATLAAGGTPVGDGLITDRDGIPLRLVTA